MECIVAESKSANAVVTGLSSGQDITSVSRLTMRKDKSDPKSAWCSVM